MPYFGKRDITLIRKKDLMAYRGWRQDYWVTGPGFEETGGKKKPPTQARLKQEGTVSRGVFLHGVDLGGPQNMLPFLKHEKSSINKRPAFTQDEHEKLRLILMGWPFKNQQLTGQPRPHASTFLRDDHGQFRHASWRGSPSKMARSRQLQQ
ncbi:hypothetical protein WOC76_04770 [Methylocystis sp. IM3]|uniref:hypothetical protein n=1 Tax=unclassified Methylocystis TaxID=2625913 RepID=UPI0030FA7CC0